MAMPDYVSEAWAKLSENRQKQVEDFIQFMLEQQKKEESKAVKPFKFGALRGQIKVYDNFDDPIPGFEDYM